MIEWVRIVHRERLTASLYRSRWTWLVGWQRDYAGREEVTDSLYVGPVALIVWRWRG